MIQFTIKQGDIDRVIKTLKVMEVGNPQSTLRSGFKALTIETAGKLQENLRAGKYLNRRTGHLAQSIGSAIHDDSDGSITGIVGSGVRTRRNRLPYANIHEPGGHITPKSSKYLAIPIGKALTASGVARFKPRQIEQRYDDSAVFKSKSGALIIWGIMRGKRKTRVDPLFVLKKSVTIPARYYMSKTVKELTPRVAEIMVRGVKAHIH